jgi:hypothetical protein
MTPNWKQENQIPAIRWITGIEDDLGVEADQEVDLGLDQGLEAEVAAKKEAESRNPLEETIMLEQT